MASLTSCIKKAGAALSAEDKAAVLDRFNALTKSGVATAAAARQAIDEQIKIVRRLLAQTETTAETPAAAPVEQGQNQVAHSASDEARDSAPGAGAEEGLTLEAQTEDGLRAKAEREQSAKDADAAEQKRLSDKAKADAQRDEFTLTGSDRPADVGAAAGQGGLFDTPEPAQPAAERFAAGRALTKAERKQVLDSLVDVYKSKGAPREQKGIGRDGNERYGYVHSPELFEKSDITGAMVRYYVTLPDGRRAHPSELFPDYTQSDIDAEMAAREASKRDRQSDVQRATVPAQQFSTIREAVEWWDKRSRESARTATGLPTIFPSEERRPLTNGSKFILVPNTTSGEMLEAFAEAGWQVQRAEQPAAASAAPPAQQAEPAGDMLGEFLASYDTPQEAGSARKALATTVTWKDRLKGPLSDHILGEYRKGARVTLTASGMAFVNSDMRGWSKRDIGEYGMQFANWLSSRDDAPAQQAEPSAPAEPDYLAELFGTPEQQAAAQAKFTADAEAKKRGMARVRDAIAEQKKRAATEYDEWAGKVYKQNKTQVDLRGDGPSNQASMSIGAINESRRRNAMEALSQEMRALDKLADEVSTDSGAERVQASLSRLYEQAAKIAADGTSLFKTADEQFQYMLLDDLKFRGPSGKGNVTSNGLSKAMLAAIKPSAPAPAEPASGIEPTAMSRDQYVEARLDAARNDPNDPEYRVVQNYASMGQIGKWERGFKSKLEAEHFEAAQQAKERGTPVSDAVRYDYPRMFIRDDLSDGQADEASDAMTAEYRQSGDFGKAVAVYRDFGKTLKQRADSMRRKPEGEAAPIADVGEKIGGARKDMAVSTGTTRRKSDDDRPAWARRFNVSQIVTPGGMIGEVKDAGRWIIRDSKNTDWVGKPKQVGGTFATKEEADAAVPIAAVSQKHRVVLASTRQGEADRYEIWRDISDRKRVKVVEQQFDSRDEAMRYMAVNAVAILETNTTFGEGDIPLPPDRTRTGPERRTGNVTGEDFKATFGLRGVEFGNWNNQDERQSLMNDAWDGLMDLADVLGIPPKAIGLNGDLALAFGARGHGLQSARAHYELDRAVINLTKERGAGSLAHEWFHALDHYFGRQDGKASPQWEVKADGTRALKTNPKAEDDMVSSGFRGNRSGVRPEVREAYDALIKTMTTKAQTYVEDMAKVDKFTGVAREDLARSLDSLRRDLAMQQDVRYWRRNNAPAPAEVLAEFDAIAKAMLDGDVASITTDWRLLKADKGRAASRYTNDALERLSAIYKQVRGRSGFDGTNRNGVLDKLGSNLTRYAQRLKLLADAQSGAEKTKNVPTQFAMDARELDQGRGGDYWTTPHEMAARAFQGYVEDKIAGRGGVSRFLNYGPENVGILTPWGFKRPFPTGEERKAINAAFDRLVGVIETRPGQDGNVAMFSRGTQSTWLGALAENDALFALPRPVGKDVSGIAFEVDPEILVRRVAPGPGQRAAWRVTLPNDGGYAVIGVREATPGVQRLYGFKTNDQNEITDPLFVRPGLDENAQADDDTAEVILDASKVTKGGGGDKVYLIAGALAHNTSRIFIGDPAGVSPAAMRRRAEQMLSLALKYGGTEFLAPHPDQVAGRGDLGLPPLKWVAGDDEANIASLVAFNVAAVENALPTAKDIEFDLDTGEFRNVHTGRPIPRDQLLGKATRRRREGSRVLEAAEAGGRTIARAAVLRAVLRRSGSEGQGRDGLRPGVLEQLARSSGLIPAGTFYSRGRGRGISMRDAEAVKATIRRAMPNAPDISLLESVDQAPEGLREQILMEGADEDVEAAYWNGAIYAFPAHMASVERALFVIGRHEVRHHGMRTRFGKALDEQLHAMWRGNQALRVATAAIVKAGRAKESERAKAIEEALADMPVERIAALKGFDRFVAAIRSWLRGVAQQLRRRGFEALADAIDPTEWTDNDVAAFVLKAEQVAGPGGTGGAFSRRTDIQARAKSIGLPATGTTEQIARLVRIADADPRTWTREDFGLIAPHLSVHQDMRDGASDRIDAILSDGLRSGMVDNVAALVDGKRWTWGKSLTNRPAYVFISGGLRYKAAGNPWLAPGNKPLFAIQPEHGHDFYAALTTAVLPPTGRAIEDGRFSRATEALDAWRAASTARAAATLFDDMTRSSKSFNWWHRTVGTQFHKAKTHTGFRRVYDAAQEYLHDTSAFANDPAELAPKILPQLKTLADALRPLALKPADHKALSRAVFEGTLNYTRDDSGTLREADEQDTPGVVFTPQELKTVFGFTDAQVTLYQQSRAATDRSLDILVASDVARLLGDGLPQAIKRMVSDGDVGRFKGLVKAFATDMLAKAEADLAALRKRNRNEMAGLWRRQKAALEGREGRPGTRLATLERFDAERAQIKLRHGGEIYRATRERDKWAELEKNVADKYARIDQLKANGYAPLMRFGRYTVDVVDSQGARLFFGMFETEPEANAAARKFRQAEPEAVVTQGVMSEQAFKQFSGLTPETIELFAEVAGVEKTALFEEYLRRAKNNRSALKRLIRRTGVAGFSDDVPRVLASFITSNARAASAGLHMGEIAAAVEDIPKEQGDVKDEAIKLREYVQNPQEEAQGIRTLLFAQYLGGSVASALVNMTQPFMMTLPYLSQFGGPVKAARRMAEAMKSAVGNVDPKSQLGRALALAEREGIVSPQELHQLQAEASRSLGNNPHVRRALFVWGSFFSLAEQFNRRVSFIAAFNTAVEQKQSDPFAFAAAAVDETQGVYNKGNRPNWARGAIGATVFTFKQYSISYVEFLKRLPKREQALALGLLILAAGLQGLPGADDLDDLIDTVGQHMGYATNAKAWKQQALEAAIGEDMADIALRGFSGMPGFPLDVSTRLSLGNLIPGTGFLRKDSQDKSREVVEAIGPFGSTVANTVQALPSLLQGDIGKAHEVAGFVAIKNLAKGLEMYLTGEYRDRQGRRVTDVTVADAAVKAIGFQPADVARDSRAAQAVNQRIGLARTIEDEIAGQWARGMADGKPEQVQAARERLVKWNRDNPEAPIVITGQQIRRRVQQLRMTRDERMVKAAPREMRQAMAEALQ